MSNQENENDSFEEERLDSQAKNKEFREARNKGTDNFHSFSEGLATVDKFDIVGDLQDGLGAEESSEDEELTNRTDSEMGGGSFESFSDGLESVDKFEITGIEDGDPDSIRIALSEFLNHPGCIANSSVVKGRSKTLTELLERIEKCGWKSEISVCIHKNAFPSEFNFLDKVIHLDMTRPRSNQLFDLVHQLYHAAHRYLHKLYKHEPVDEHVFKDTFLWSEAGALLAELNVKRELDLYKAGEIGFKIATEKGGIKTEYIESILNRGGAKLLRILLVESLSRDDFINKSTLLDKLDEYYQHYIENFSEQKEKSKELIALTKKAGIPKAKI